MGMNHTKTEEPLGSPSAGASIVRNQHTYSIETVKTVGTYPERHDMCPQFTDQVCVDHGVVDSVEPIAVPPEHAAMMEKSRKHQFMDLLAAMGRNASLPVPSAGEPALAGSEQAGPRMPVLWCRLQAWPGRVQSLSSCRCL